MEFTPYLNFDGDCAEAFAFYAKLFKGTIAYQGTYAEAPPSAGMPPLPEGAAGRIMHVRLQVGEQVLMGSDAMPVVPGADPAESCGGYRKPQGLWVSIGVATEAEGRRIFDGLTPGGAVTMPFQKIFFSPGFGMVVDRFGIPWMVNVTTEP